MTQVCFSHIKTNMFFFKKWMARLKIYLLDLKLTNYTPMQKQLTLFHPLSKKLYMLKVLRDLNIEIISNCETVNRFSDAFKEEGKN